LFIVAHPLLPSVHPFTLFFLFAVSAMHVPSAADEDEDANAIPDAFSFDDDMPNTPVPAYSQVRLLIPRVRQTFASHTRITHGCLRAESLFQLQ
jgi:hypothetical protein